MRQVHAGDQKQARQRTRDLRDLPVFHQHCTIFLAPGLAGNIGRAFPRCNQRIRTLACNSLIGEDTTVTTNAKDNASWQEWLNGSFPNWAFRFRRRQARLQIMFLSCAPERCCSSRVSFVSMRAASLLPKASWGLACHSMTAKKRHAPALSMFLRR